MDDKHVCTGASCCGKPPGKKVRVELDRLAQVAHCMDNFLRQENLRLDTINRSLENQLTRALRQNRDFQRALDQLRRAATGAMSRSNELQNLLEVQIQMNDELHAYCQRLELRLQQHEPDFEPEFEVIDLTADSEVDSDATILEEELLDRDM